MKTNQFYCRPRQT